MDQVKDTGDLLRRKKKIKASTRHLDERDEWAQTALSTHASRGEIAEIQRLLDAGVDVNVKNGRLSEHCSALEAAADEGQYETLQFLLEHGANPNVERVRNQTTALTSAIYGLYAGPNPRTSIGGIPSIEQLLEFNERLNGTPKREPGGSFYREYESQHQAAQRKTIHEKIIKLLLLHGADTNAKERIRDGSNALELAVRLDFESAVEMLLAYGANVNAQPGEELTSEGYRSLLEAAEAKGYMRIASMLIAKGALREWTWNPEEAQLEWVPYGENENPG